LKDQLLIDAGRPEASSATADCAHGVYSFVRPKPYRTGWGSPTNLQYFCRERTVLTGSVTLHRRDGAIDRSSARDTLRRRPSRLDVGAGHPLRALGCPELAYGHCVNRTLFCRIASQAETCAEVRLLT
jgi:hypothetical protein